MVSKNETIIEMRKALVVIETRPNVGLVDVLNNHLKHLDSTWGLHLFLSKEAGQGFVWDVPVVHVNQICGVIHVTTLQGSVLTEAQYNKMLTSHLFWNLLPFDKVLITQTDANMLRSGIDEFMDFDYVGSPWQFQEYGGNGGFSLRTVSVMKQICNDFRYDPSMGNEDIFFSNLLKAYPQYGRLAPREVCKRFAMETILEYGTIGVHAIEKYHDKETCNKILTQYGI